MLPASHGTLRPVSANMRFYSQTCKHSADYPRRKGYTGSPCRGLACEACNARVPCPLRARSEPAPFVYGAGSEQAVYSQLTNKYLTEHLHHLPPPSRRRGKARGSKLACPLLWHLPRTHPQCSPPPIRTRKGKAARRKRASRRKPNDRSKVKKAKSSAKGRLRLQADRCHLSWWKVKVNYPTEKQ